MTKSMPCWLDPSDQKPGGTFNADVVVLGKALQMDEELEGVFKFCSFKGSPQVVKKPPWPGGGANYPRDLLGSDLVALRAWFNHHAVVPTREDVRDAVLFHASHFEYHPVLAYLSCLVWDGAPRIETWLHDVAGVEPTLYGRAVAKKFLVQAVARVNVPGCQADAMIVLEGPQGLGKSTLLRTLFSSEWFTDHLDDLENKDSLMQIAGKWCVEMPEMFAIGKAKANKAKAFITRPIDHFRPPYGSSVQTHPRQCIFAGTTNEEGYLKDDTGARRFWPVKCTKHADLEFIRRNRDQLWAEAAHEYEHNPVYHLTGDEVPHSEKEQAERHEGAKDPWTTEIIKFVTDTANGTGYRVGFTTVDVLHEAIDIPKERRDQANSRRAGAVLRRLGYEQKKVRTDNYSTQWQWVLSEKCSN